MKYQTRQLKMCSIQAKIFQTWSTTTPEESPQRDSHKLTDTVCSHVSSQTAKHDRRHGLLVFRAASTEDQEKRGRQEREREMCSGFGSTTAAAAAAAMMRHDWSVQPHTPPRGCRDGRGPGSPTEMCGRELEGWKHSDVEVGGRKRGKTGLM